MRDRRVEIVIADRGWVVVGEVEREDGEVIVRYGAVVRRWGAQAESLGGLARNGPLTDTVLDAFDEWRMDAGVVVGRMICRPGPWEAWLDVRRVDCREAGYVS